MSKTWVICTAELPLSSPYTNPEDKSETSKTPHLANFNNLLILEQKTGFINSFTVLANTGNYEYSNIKPHWQYKLV